MKERKELPQSIVSEGDCACVDASPETLTAWLHITNACNLRCDYCYLDHSPEAMTREQGYQAVRTTFETASTYGYERVKLKFAGGEASLAFPIVLALHDCAVDQAKIRGLRLDSILLTNGTLLSDDKILFLKEKGIHVAISLDGLGDLNDTQRKYVDGRGCYDRIDQTIDRLLKQELYPTIMITVTSRNLAGLPAFVEELLKRHLPFSFNFYRINSNSLGANNGADLTPDSTELIRVMNSVLQVIADNPPPYPLVNSLSDRAWFSSPHTQPCAVGSSFLVFSPRGIHKCPMDLEYTVCSSTDADPLGKIRSDKQGLVNLSVLEKTACRDCQWRYWCAGGCPVAAYHTYQSYAAGSPYCQVYQSIFPAILNLENLRQQHYQEIRA
jgi:uncharacterized protein